MVSFSGCNPLLTRSHHLHCMIKLKSSHHTMNVIPHNKRNPSHIVLHLAIKASHCAITTTSSDNITLQILLRDVTPVITYLCYYCIARNFQGKKTFANLWLFAKVYSTKFGYLASFGRPSEQFVTVFSAKIIFHQFVKVFSYESFPLFGTSMWSSTILKQTAYHNTRIVLCINFLHMTSLLY